MIRFGVHFLENEQRVDAALSDSSLRMTANLSGNEKERLVLDLYGEPGKRALPSGYTEVDYIKVTGTQYIDTGFKPNQDTRIICEFKYAGGTGVYGARSTVSSRNFSMRVINGAWQMGYGAGVTTGTIASDTVNWHVADHNKNELYIDGELATTREYVEFSAPYPAAIGAIRAGSMYYGQGQYRACKIYDNGTLVRDLVPCINADNEAGMYDYITDTFMGNSGTGTIGYKALSYTEGRL